VVTKFKIHSAKGLNRSSLAVYCFIISNTMDSVQTKPRLNPIVVVGGGFAGVSAARHLRFAGFSNVVLLEAAPFLGGRAQNSSISPDPSVANFCPYPIELGGEFLHGTEENMLLSYIQGRGIRSRPKAKVREVPFPNYYYFGKEGRLVSSEQAEQDEDLQHLIAVFEMIENLDADLIPEESLLQYLSRMGVKSRVIDMAYPLYANDYAGELSEVPPHSFIRWCTPMHTFHPPFLNPLLQSSTHPFSVPSTLGSKAPTAPCPVRGAAAHRTHRLRTALALSHLLGRASHTAGGPQGDRAGAAAVAARGEVHGPRKLHRSSLSPPRDPPSHARAHSS
jgi:hypothetical protein